MRAVATALPRTLLLCAALPLGGCGWLAGAGSEDAGGPLHAGRTDASRLDDAGPANDAGGPLDDAGVSDGGAPDAGGPDGGSAPDAGPPPDAGDEDAGLDAGFPDAGYDDAGDEDAGPHDAGLEDAGLDDAGRVDAGLPDAGPPPRAVVLASGSGVGSATVAIDGARLAEVDTVLVFLAREKTNAVDLPGDWTGPTYGARGSGASRVVGATRRFKDSPPSLPNPLSIGVQDEERFSYALVGVVGLGTPEDTDKHEDDTENHPLCDDGPTARHDASVSYAFYALTGLAHRQPPANVRAPGRQLVAEEPATGPSLFVQAIEGDASDGVSTVVCLGGAGPYISVAQAFELP